MTRSIGRRCKVRNGLSRAVLMTQRLLSQCGALLLRLDQSVIKILSPLTEKSRVPIPPGSHLFPFRTEKLNPAGPMVLPSLVGE